MRSIKPLMSLNTLKTIYYSFFNAIISYVAYLFGETHPHSVKIFRMHKRVIRIMIGCENRVSYRSLFRRFEILPFVSHYTLSLMLFLVKNKNLFILNSVNHTKSRRQFKNFYQPILILIYTKVDYITWALKSSTVFLHSLKAYLIMFGNLKFVYDSYLYILFTTY